jgi:hypothetical protein
MNKLQLFVYPVVAAISLAAALSAHAAGPLVDIGTTQAAAQGKTRAEVKAELLQAVADGSYKAGSVGYDPLAFVTPARTARAVPAAKAPVAGDDGRVLAVKSAP